MDLFKVKDILKNETVQKFPSTVEATEFRQAIWVAIEIVDEEIDRMFDAMAEDD